MDNVVFAGCSFTTGYGLDPEGLLDNQTHPDLWVNLCHQDIDVLKNLELINIGMSGASNTNVFINIIDQLSQRPAKFLICQWTGYPRYLVKPDFEPRSTNQRSICLLPQNPSLFKNFKWKDSWVAINGTQKITQDYIQDVKDKFLVLHHHHYEVCKLLHSINIIHRICEVTGTKIIHINGLCPWDQDFFSRVETANCMPEDYTDYTKQEIIRLKYRTDHDAHLLYNQAHDEYKKLGGIRPDHWVNLYKSFSRNKQDLANDGLHPGKQSNFEYFKMVKNYFDQNKQFELL